MGGVVYKNQQLNICLGTPRKGAHQVHSQHLPRLVYHSLLQFPGKLAALRFDTLTHLTVLHKSLDIQAHSRLMYHHLQFLVGFIPAKVTSQGVLVEHLQHLRSETLRYEDLIGGFMRQL